MPGKGPDLKICKGYLLIACCFQFPVMFLTTLFSKPSTLSRSYHRTLTEDTWNVIPQESIQGQVHTEMK